MSDSTCALTFACINGVREGLNVQFVWTVGAKLGQLTKVYKWGIPVDVARGWLNDPGFETRLGETLGTVFNMYSCMGQKRSDLPDRLNFCNDYDVRYTADLSNHGFYCDGEQADVDCPVVGWYISQMLSLLGIPSDFAVKAILDRLSRGESICDISRTHAVVAVYDESVPPSWDESPLPSCGGTDALRGSEAEAEAEWWGNDLMLYMTLCACLVGLVWQYANRNTVPEQAQEPAIEHAGVRQLPAMN